MKPQGMPYELIPRAQATGGRPRKEAIYDRECYPNGKTLATTRRVFNNSSSFAETPVTVVLTKQEGRDTNVTGSAASGLPANHEFKWFFWRHIAETLGVNLADPLYKGVSEEIQRFISLGFSVFKFTQTALVQSPMRDLPAGVGPAWGSTTHNDTTVYGPNCVPNRVGKSISINKRPTVIVALQQFFIENSHPEAGFNPTVDLYSMHTLDGILTRAIVG